MGAVRLVRGDVCVPRAGDGEVCWVHTYQSNERIFVYEISYVSHFDVEIGRPYLSYGRHFPPSFWKVVEFERK